MDVKGVVGTRGRGLDTETVPPPSSPTPVSLRTGGRVPENLFTDCRGLRSQDHESGRMGGGCSPVVGRGRLGRTREKDDETRVS